MGVMVPFFCLVNDPNFIFTYSSTCHPRNPPPNPGLMMVDGFIPLGMSTAQVVFRLGQCAEVVRKEESETEGFPRAKIAENPKPILPPYLPPPFPTNPPTHLSTYPPHLPSPTKRLPHLCSHYPSSLAFFLTRQLPQVGGGGDILTTQDGLETESVCLW